ncbi:MAG: hypothetical protein JXA98_08590 [Methanosarcinaceae archaeon]|nr:hypothetical protein [Methanosarcinaceae archaeon]
MNDLPWEVKKDSKKEPSMDAPSVEFPWEKSSSTEGAKEPPAFGGIPDLLASAFEDIPMEEVETIELKPALEPEPIVTSPFGDVPDLLESITEIKEETEKTEPQETPFAPQPPFFSNIPNINETITPSFETEGLQVTTVHAVEQKKPPEIPVINEFPGEENTGIQNVIPTKPDEAGAVDSFVEVYGLEQDEKASMGRLNNLIPRSKTPPPLFEPNFPTDDRNIENIMVDDLPTTSQPSFFEIGDPTIHEPESVTVEDEKDATVNTESWTLQTPANVPFEKGTEQLPPSFPIPNTMETPSPYPIPNAMEAPSPFPTPNTMEAPSPFPTPNTMEAPSPFPTPNTMEAPSPFPVSGVEGTTSPFPPMAPVPPSSRAAVKTAASAADSARKTVEGISALFKNTFKNLMRGGSLIDRMEEMRGKVDLAKDERLKEEMKEKVAPEVSPFEKETGIVAENLGPLGMGKETTTITSTPPAPPEMRMVEEETAKIIVPDELPFEKEPEIIAEKPEPRDTEEETLTMPPISQTFPEIDIAKEEKQEETNAVSEIGISDEDVKEIVMAQIEKVLSERLGSADDESSLKSKDVEELKDEIAGSKARFDEIVDNIEALSNAVTTAHDSIQTMKNNSDEFDSAREKIDVIEIRLGGVEETLATIQSDNTDLKNGLSNIEQNVSELLNSYSVLFTQINESAASNESRISELSEKANRIDTIESTVQNLEKSLATTGETIVELGNTMSALMNNVAETYEANKSLRNDSKIEFQKFHEEMNSFTKHVEKEIKKVGAEGYRSLGQSIQLTHVQKNSATMKVCMEWLEFLMELVGRNNLPDILAYYEELEWITDDVRMELLRYAEGIDYYLEKPDWKLNPDDHVKSIWFIEKLAGVKVDKNRLSIIDRDIEKVKKGMEIHGI